MSISRLSANHSIIVPNQQSRPSSGTTPSFNYWYTILGSLAQGISTLHGAEMSKRDLHSQLGLLSLIFIYVVIRELAVLPLCIYLYLQLIVEGHRICEHIREFRKKVQREEEQRRRSREISIISTAVSAKLGQIVTEETKKLEAARKEARGKRSEDVATIVSLVMKQLFELQAEEKTKEEAERLSAQREAESVARQERLRQEAQSLAKLEEEKRKAAERERLATLERQKAASEFTRYNLPRILRDLNPVESSFTCIGQTLAGNRCKQWMFSRSDLADAASRLEIMRSKDPGNSFEEAQLLQLANWLLCPRWHRDKKPQGMGISSQWYQELKPARDVLSASKQAIMTPPVTPQKGLKYHVGSPVPTPPWSGNSTASTAVGSSPGFSFGSPTNSKVPLFGYEGTSTHKLQSEG